MKAKELLQVIGASFVLILLGDGVVAMVGLAPRLGPAGYDWNTIVWGWALAVLFSAYIAGGNNNPAVTIAFAVRGELPWSKVGPYVFCEMLGSFLGAAVVYACYRDGLVAAGVPNVWCTGPGSTFGTSFWGGVNGSQSAGVYSLFTACVTEFVGTVVLMWAILAVNDRRNKALGIAGAVIVSAAVLAIGISLGGPSGYAINPSRDLGPRLFGVLAGTTGLFEGSYWLLAPIVAPIVGAIVASYLYDAVFASEPEPEPARSRVAAHEPTA